MLRQLVEAWQRVPQWLRVLIGLQVVSAGVLMRFVAVRIAITNAGRPGSRSGWDSPWPRWPSAAERPSGTGNDRTILAGGIHRGDGMNVRFLRDADGMLHIQGHGVTEQEVLDVLGRPIEDRPGTDDSRVAIGQTQGGRYLRVNYVPDPEPDSVFVITAYDVDGKPLRALKRRMRRRNR